MLLLRWLVSALSLLLVAYLVPGFEVAGVYAALIAALILGLVNAVIRPVLLLLTLPINILTLGLFTFIINALMLWFVASFIDGFAIASFGTAVWAAIILWLVGWVTNTLLVAGDQG
ncbi:phage holin family protein [Candidatus Berkelbacteria bacterium]|nr:phage holin family protein [Candidatus Berkelbacteria bacterium]